jgi:hypothetical protein
MSRIISGNQLNNIPGEKITKNGVNLYLSIYCITPQVLVLRARKKIPIR